MTVKLLDECQIPFRAVDGSVMAQLHLTATRDAVSAASAPLVLIPESEALECGETSIQLRESERYEYEIHSESGRSLRLRSSVSTRRRSLKDSAADAGLIETRSHCGTLLLELFEEHGEKNPPTVASALVDVRSVKLDYRTEYRGMLRRLADELVGLVVDARSSAKMGFQSSYEDRSDAGWMQIQLELLRETLDSAEFNAALQRILSAPHERLTSELKRVSSDRPIRWNATAVRDLVAGNPRRRVPHGHPLHTGLGLQNIASRVRVQQKARELDTPENRFVRFALEEFRSFLSHAERAFESKPGWTAAATVAHRLAGAIDDWLGRAFFRQIGQMRIAPLGSPVLQRRAGYRELLRWWLRFRTAAELSWDGGEDLFRAGKRDVASLYEYWLFFELLRWFCEKCRSGRRPEIESLVDGLGDGSPNLRLKKKLHLGPFTGEFAGPGRQLSARFSYNRQFAVTRDRAQSGSWSRRLHPDYTLTFWPAEYEEAEAERRELLVHVHFDAKYRVEDIESLFGAEDSDADEESDGNYARQDLLKMHAYRDAIKRSQGAYVLYPGSGRPPVKMSGFHEILPGLGAFAVTPDENGSALGVGALDEFLNEVLHHLSNRTTAQERVSFHVAESYAGGEPPVPYGELVLPESDIYGMDYRALPPAEQMVLTAWFNNPSQQALAEDDHGFTYVRLGCRRGSLHVHPNLAKVRYVMLRSGGGNVADGLLVVREHGFRVFTRSQLRGELAGHAKGKGVAAWESQAADDDEEHIYALFKTRRDPAYAGQSWESATVNELIISFESDARNKLVERLGRNSPYPRVLPLRDLLKAQRV